MELPTLPMKRQMVVEQVERLIREKTNGLIRGLRVEILPGRVILSGRTTTYYLKQLATHAVLDAIHDSELTNSIEVH